MNTITLKLDELTEARLNVRRLEIKAMQERIAESQQERARKVGGKIELQEPTMEDAALHALKQGLEMSCFPRPFMGTGQTIVPLDEGQAPIVGT